VIFDQLSTWRTCTSLSPLLREAFAWLEAHADSATPGTYELHGQDLRAIVSDYTTRPIESLRFEAHRDFIDIQCLARGEEALWWAPIARLEVEAAYDQAKDVAFYRMPADPTPLRLVPGSFAVLFPSDGHAPGGMTTAPMEVRKIVMKVRAG
jgi:YhcH/YjgK/YiaL family protein